MVNRVLLFPNIYPIRIDGGGRSHALNTALKQVRLGTDACILWSGDKHRSGYGFFHAKRVDGMSTPVLAHRLVYTIFRGPIGDGLTLDHLCRTVACVNPRHLEAVTCRENLMRGVGFAARNYAATHCKRGHPLAGDNLRLYKGHRVCQQCRTLRQRDRRAKHR